MAVLVYLAADVVSPSVPGVFSFAQQHLFVDGAVRVKCDGPETPPVTPTPVARAAFVDVERRPVAAVGPLHGVAWLELVRPALRSHARRRSTPRSTRTPSPDDD